MSTNHADPFKQKKIAGIIFLGFTPLLIVSSAFGQTGSYNWMQAASLSPGVKYVNYDAASPSDPRTNQVNCLQIDTTTPNLRFYSTPRYNPYVVDSHETSRQTTRNFVATSQTSDHKMVAAINANAFDMVSGPTDLKGLAVSEGVLVSPGSGTLSLCSFTVSKQGIPDIVWAPGPDYNTTNVQTAVSGWIGDGLCLDGGSPRGVGGDSLNPRTGIGVSEDHRYVYFMTIDGRQPAASQGAYVLEVGSYLKYFGSHNGLNVDGGGSTTMAWWNPNHNSSELLNVPSGSERAVGNNIGIYYVPEPTSITLLATIAVVVCLWNIRSRHFIHFAPLRLGVRYADASSGLMQRRKGVKTCGSIEE